MRNLRLKKGLSQESLADLMGISQSYYNRLENGNADFKIELLNEAAQALGVKIEDLVSQQECLHFSNNAEHNMGGNFHNVNNHTEAKVSDNERSAYLKLIEEQKEEIKFLRDTIDKLTDN